MALTRDFKETVMELCKDQQYRVAILIEALESYLEGDIVVGNSLFRDYLNGTKNFGKVASMMQMQEAGLRRMLSPKGNGTAKNMFRLFKTCLELEGMSSLEFLQSSVANDETFTVTTAV
ncbi:MAG: hypothetical protein KUG82_22150 [Pseudomonadales bacterium]|nr:hypothetical protein [Pseudomonadales bacterium]